MNLLDSVSGHKVFIIKTFDNQKINDGIMELILAISCMKKAGASSVVAIIPYFPYSRVDGTWRLIQLLPPKSRPSTLFSQPISQNLLRAVAAT